MSVRVISWVFDHSPVDQRGDLLVLLVLADHAHDDGDGAYPSVAKIAKKARLTRRGVQLALRRLTERGAINATGHGPKGTVAYRVVMTGGEVSSPSEVSSPPTGEVTAPGGEVSDTEGRSDCAQGANPPSPEPSVEPSLEPSKPPQPPASGGSRELDLAEFTDFRGNFARKRMEDKALRAAAAWAEAHGLPARTGVTAHDLANMAVRAWRQHLVFRAPPVDPDLIADHWASRSAAHPILSSPLGAEDELGGKWALRRALWAAEDAAEDAA